MQKLLTILAGLALTLALAPVTAFAQGAECGGGLCGTPNQSGGGCGCGCGSVLVAMTDRGDTYQFADDFDGDGIEDEFDNCAFAANYDQTDGDGDLVGDSCDLCPAASDPTQSNIDGDTFGDACDNDPDGDTIIAGDNCPLVPNTSQVNTDVDSQGDACDTDDDNDGLTDDVDPCRLAASGSRLDCNGDADGDGLLGDEDNCPDIYNPQLDAGGAQLDLDVDGFGDACDLDKDGDLVPNFGDNCVGTANPSQLDVDMDGLGDAGDWAGGAESCDTRECYVIAGDAANCLDPQQAFSIYLTLVGDRVSGEFQVGDEIIVALFSNRLGALHNWTARFGTLPADSDASLLNGKGAGNTEVQNPQVTNGAGDVIKFTPDQPGQYTIRVTSTVPGDMEATASYTIVADVGGEAKGGCAATSGGFAALALGLLLGVLRRRR
jgi:uncharacterized protein (TIGR03382 family)